MTAALLTALAAFVGAGVDLGILYTAKSQLQAAADSAALAGANELVRSIDNVAVANYDGAESTARQLAGQNELFNHQLSGLIATDPETYGFQAGLWDLSLGDFSRTGYSANPDDLTGVRVTLNRTVETNFARIVGIREVDISASATAFLGWAASTPQGVVDLPIAVQRHAFNSCQDVIRYSPENEETAAWTAFFNQNTDANNIRPYIEGTTPCPGLSVGDQISLNNGVITTLFQELEQRWLQERDSNGQWRVLLPVVDESGPTQGSVIGFAYFVITEVLGPPAKQLTGHLECGSMIADGSTTGGANLGTRAARSMLIR